MKTGDIHYSLFISYFLFLIPYSFIYGQDTLVIEKKVEHRIEFSGDAFLYSNTLSNNFILAFYRDDFIDDELKSRALGTARNILSDNRFGAASKLGFTYSVERDLKSRPTQFSFSFFDRQHFDMKFSDDLFYTVFYGNKLFAGQTAELGNFHFNLLRYQQFRFGWDWKGDVRHGAYGFAFSLLSGEQNLSANAEKADLFTSADERYIDFSLAMTLQQTDTAQKKFFAQNGMGLSADFFYEIPYTVWKKPGKITFQMNDFGFIRWKNNSLLYSVDSSYHYEGVDVEDIFNLNSAVFSFNIDSVIDNNTMPQTNTYTTALPFTLDIHTNTFYGKRFAFEKGIIFRFNTSAAPYYYTKFHFFAGKKNSFELAYIFGYGGYGKFIAGLETKVDFEKYYSIQLIADNLFSEITNHSSTGMGLYLKLARKFYTHAE